MLIPRKKRRSWGFICQRFLLTVAVPDCAFKRVFSNFCLSEWAPAWHLGTYSAPRHLRVLLGAEVLALTRLCSVVKPSDETFKQGRNA